MLKRNGIAVSFIVICFLFWQKPVSLTNSPVNISKESYNYTKPHDTLKILSWNIYMIPGCQVYASGIERAKKIGKSLKKSSYDILVFQEAFDNQIRRNIRKELKGIFPFEYGPANNYSSLLLNSGLWVLSRFPLYNMREFVFENAYGAEKLARKGGILLEGVFNNTCFQIAATHLQATGDPLIREAQIDELKKKLLNAFNPDKLPQIICGDFNTAEEEAAEYHEMLAELDARCGEWSSPNHITYDLNNPLTYGVDYSRTIDFVLFKDPNQLISDMDLRVQQFRYGEGERAFMSDHYGVEADVVFRKELSSL